jgi:glycosyltransferase involved in cell wall biosynthesis
MNTSLVKVEMLKKKKKLLIINSHISWGGLGQYSIGLARAITELGEFDVFGLVTHSNTDRFHEFSSSTKKTFFPGEKLKLSRYWLTFWHIWRLRPDVIVINYNATVHFLLPFLPRTKIVTIIHSDDMDYYRIAAINRSFVDAWIAPTPKTGRGMLDYLKSDAVIKKVHVIPHGVAGPTMGQRDMSRARFEILFVGALYIHKGVDLLPEIFSRFLPNHPNATLTIVGGGPMRDRIIQDIQSRNLLSHIELTGVLTTEAVRAMYTRADVLLFPTRLEGFGLVLAEAMMEGCVPVATNLQDITDSIVSTGESGYLVEKDDITGFVKALSNLYNDRTLLSSMSERASEVAREKFLLSGMAKKYTSLFNRI